MSWSKTIVLKSSDGETFEVVEAVAVESQTIKHMIEDECADTIIPLPNVTSKILSKVIYYCKKHAANADEMVTEEDIELYDAEYDKVAQDPDALSSYLLTPNAEEDLKSFDADFVKVDDSTLFDLILAANYLNIKSLLDLTCQTVADMIRGKTPEEICKRFNIKNESAPEEEEEVRRDNAWAFE